MSRGWQRGGMGGGQGQANQIVGGGVFPQGAGVRAPGANGVPQVATALPAALSQLINSGGAAMPTGGAPATPNQSGINMQALQMGPTGTVASNPNYPVLDFRMQPTYADGGPVPGMQPGMMQQGMQPQGMPMQRVSINDMQGEAARVMQQNPQVMQQIQQSMQEALQSGELTMDQLNMAIQMAVAAAQNPELYPRLRALAIQRGLADEDELPMQYDQSIVFAMIMAGQALGAGASQQQAPMQQLANGGSVYMNNRSRARGYADGGHMPQEASPTGDNTGRADDISIRVSGGEYIIPKHIVERKGTEYFDKLIGKS